MILFITLISALSSSANAIQAEAVNCRPSNSWATNTVQHLTRIVTGTDPGNIKLRQAFNLPYVTTSPQVALVVDEIECGRAAAAVRSLYADGLSRGPVHVFRVGSNRFGVSDGSAGERGNIVVIIFDTEYNYLLTLD